MSETTTHIRLDKTQITLIKGASKYRWTISVEVEDDVDAVSRVINADVRLLRRYEPDSPLIPAAPPPSPPEP